MLSRQLAESKLAEYGAAIKGIEASIAAEMCKPIRERSHHRLLLLLYRERVKYSFAKSEIEQLLSHGI